MVQYYIKSNDGQGKSSNRRPRDNIIYKERRGEEWSAIQLHCNLSLIDTHSQVHSLDRPTTEEVSALHDYWYGYTKREKVK